jgi:uncharacterized YkwD family protein/spore coat assembly protein SafA
MLKKILPFALFIGLLSPSFGMAQGTENYTVQKNDTLWKIAVKYQIGVKEIIDANPQIPNPDLIYPMQKINIPNIDQTKSIEEQVARIVNEQRKNNGLKPLSMDWELQRVARIKACDMAQKGYFSHTSPTYGSPFDMMKQYNIEYRTAGENIAKGQTSAVAVMDSWLNSQGHRANILKPDFTHIGVGYCESGNHWVQMFIGK